MATIADTLYKPDGTALTSQVVYFSVYGGPWFRSTGATTSGRVSVTTHATTGAFSTTLLEGVYRATWRTSSALGSQFNEKLIEVPSGSSTYGLDEIEVDSTGATANALHAIDFFDTVAAFEAATLKASVRGVHILADGNGDQAWFIKSSSTHTSDQIHGVDYVTNGGADWFRG